MSSQFQLPSASPSLSPNSTSRNAFSPPNVDSDDDSDLPYPAELQRSAFLADDFNPQTYLSSLRNRHQTLEDLRSDLRQRSQLLNKELLDLVNGNYEEFLSLGAGLKGGEEKVEGVRVGVLGFGREVEGMRKAVEERSGEMDELLTTKKQMRRSVVFGRALLELHEKVQELEEALNVNGKGANGTIEDGIDDDQDEEIDVDANVSSSRRLQRRSRQYALIVRLLDQTSATHIRHNPTADEHPMMVSLRPRISELRRLLLLDLSSELRQAKAAKATDDIITLMGLFTLLDTRSEMARAAG